MSASGLAAVWAEENSREAILSAMQRRETYATTGPRIRVRFLGGWRGTAADPEAGANAAADADVFGDNAVPMGGELTLAAPGAVPSFRVEAQKDPAGAHLDRVQIVKGWLDANDQRQEQVFDAVWSGERQPDAQGKLPPVGNTVDLQTARYSNNIGAAELSATWRDPAFDPGQPAFYYARVLEIPTPATPTSMRWRWARSVPTTARRPFRNEPTPRPSGTAPTRPPRRGKQPRHDAACTEPSSIRPRAGLRLAHPPRPRWNSQGAVCACCGTNRANDLTPAMRHRQRRCGGPPPG